jgi:hypothetical protein
MLLIATESLFDEDLKLGDVDRVRWHEKNPTTWPSCCYLDFSDLPFCICRDVTDIWIGHIHKNMYMQLSIHLLVYQQSTQQSKRCITNRLGNGVLKMKNWGSGWRDGRIILHQ